MMYDVKSRLKMTICYSVQLDFISNPILSMCAGNIFGNIEAVYQISVLYYVCKVCVLWVA